jgi:tetratricopeptide (TPR) repeat protein
MEEFLERYPHDPRVVQVQFILANAYRKSGLALLEAADGSGKGSTGGMDGPARLTRAETLFGEVVRQLDARKAESLSPIEQLYLKYSHLYEADCAFDQTQYERAVGLYERVCRRFRRDPISLSAYVQILNCYQRTGRDGEARAVLQRIGWLLKTIPAERFEAMPGGQSLAQWQGFVDWVEKSGLF